MIEIYKDLFIGDDSDCQRSNIAYYAIIHACKTCHQKALHYSKNLSSSHPNYLIYERDNHLYLNMVDMDKELLAKFTNPIIRAAIDFIDKWIPNQKVLIHCNQGFSRSPSIALVYMSVKSFLPNQSYPESRTAFLKQYPSFSPGIGMELYLMGN